MFFKKIIGNVKNVTNISNVRDISKTFLDDLNIKQNTNYIIPRALDLSSYYLICPFGSAKHRSFSALSMQKIAACFNKKALVLTQSKTLDLAKKSGLDLAIADDIFMLFLLIKNASMIISVDTASVHIAYALNKPTICVNDKSAKSYEYINVPNVINIESTNFNDFSFEKLQNAIKKLEATS